MTQRQQNGLPWDELKSAIDKVDSVLLTTHVRPDGDALGSELGMAELLEMFGKKVEIYNSSPTPPRYRFLDAAGTRIGYQIEGVGEPKSKPDLFIVLDTGTWSQLAGLTSYVRQLDVPRFVVDHHVTQDDLGATRIVDSDAPACGILVYRAFRHFGMKPSPVAAEALFAAIAMDTGWMHHSNTTPEVLSVLAELVELGAQPNEIYRQLFESDSPARLKLLGIMLSHLKTDCDGKLAYSFVTQQDIRNAQAHPMDTEDFITLPMAVAGVDAAALFIEQREGGTKISLRSRGLIDCSATAALFGGGGHKPAAGATVATPLEQTIDSVLAVLRKKIQG